MTKANYRILWSQRAKSSITTDNSGSKWQTHWQGQLRAPMKHRQEVGKATLEWHLALNPQSPPPVAYVSNKTPLRNGLNQGLSIHLGLSIQALESMGGICTQTSTASLPTTVPKATQQL